MFPAFSMSPAGDRGWTGWLSSLLSERLWRQVRHPARERGVRGAEPPPAMSVPRALCDFEDITTVLSLPARG